MVARRAIRRVLPGKKKKKKKFGRPKPERGPARERREKESYRPT